MARPSRDSGGVLHGPECYVAISLHIKIVYLDV